MASLISDIVEQQIIAKLDNVLQIVGIVPGTPYKVKFCSDKWLSLFGEATIDGTVVPLTSPDAGGYYDMPEAFAPTYNSVATIAKPIFFNGTLLNTKIEWARFSLKERDKLPFVWLTSPTPQTFPGGNPGVKRSAQLDLWLVHWSDWGKLNADRQQEAVRPLFALLDGLLGAITQNPAFEGFDVANIKDFPKFATETPDGAENMLFDSTLSAVNANLNVRIFSDSCNNC